MPDTLELTQDDIKRLMEEALRRAGPGVEMIRQCEHVRWELKDEGVQEILSDLFPEKMYGDMIPIYINTDEE